MCFCFVIRPMLALALCSVVTKVDSLVEPLCEKVADEFKLGNGSEVIVIHVSEIHSAYASLTEDLIDAFVAAESAVLNADAASYARALSVDSSSSSSSPPTPAMDAFVQGIVSVDACLTALFHVSPAEKKSAQHSSRRFYEAGRWSKSTEHFSYEYVLERVVENALRALSECVRLHTYAEDNRYTSDKSSLENALVGCYGGLSELTLLLDKIELDVHCRTVRAVTDETETETKGEEKTQEEEKKEEETAET